MLSSVRLPVADRSLHGYCPQLAIPVWPTYAGSLSLTFFIYVFVNMSMVSGILPVVGVPLPFNQLRRHSDCDSFLGFGILMAISTEPKRIRMSFETKTIEHSLSACDLALLPPCLLADYSTHPEAAAFVDTMVQNISLSAEEIVGWLSYAKHQSSIVKAMSRPAEKVNPGIEYRKALYLGLRIERGLQFWREKTRDIGARRAEFGVTRQLSSALLALKPTMAATPAATR